MTIQAAIDQVDRMKPNSIEHEEKITWLSKLDQMIWNEVFTKHVIPAPGTTPAYTVQDGYWPDPLSPDPIREKPLYVLPDQDLIPKPNYGNETDTSTELLVESPYDDLYPLYLAARIDLVNQEFDLYGNNQQLYNNAYQTYVDYVHRTYPQRVRRTRWKL